MPVLLAVKFPGVADIAAIDRDLAPYNALIEQVANGPGFEYYKDPRGNYTVKIRNPSFGVAVETVLTQHEGYIIGEVKEDEW